MKTLKLLCYLLTIFFIFTGTQLFGQFFPRFSEGLYRIPYQDFQQINMSSDVWTHNPLGKYDMQSFSSDKLIVAAGSGWIRGIQESFNVACYEQDEDGNVTVCCWDKNNYVVIEHPNGEWSGYTHIKVNSATQQGISMNQWVTVGTPIGVEGNVGCSSGRHLHFELTRPTDPNNPFQPIGGFLTGEPLIPVICGVGTSQSWFVKGGAYFSIPCSDDCLTSAYATQSLNSGDEAVFRADQIIENINGNSLNYGFESVAQFRAGSRVILNPGFTAATGSKFQAIIKGCNQQN